MSRRNTRKVIQSNREGEKTMSKQFSFTKKKPNIPFTVVGFGQGGGNIANEFARYRLADGQKSYEVFAVNSNNSDLTTLTNIREDNRIWLGKDDQGKDFAGFGKSAEYGTKKLQSDTNAQQVLSNLINERLGKEEQQHLVFIACEGGGTGTSMLNEAIRQFKKTYRDHILDEAKEKVEAFKKQLIERFGEADGQKTFDKQRNAINQKINAFIKESLENVNKHLSVIITLPSRNDGGQVLKQTSTYTSELWEMTLDRMYGIGNIIVVDNQFLEDEYDKLEDKSVDVFTYINQKTANIIHELNVGSKIGDTNKVLDAKDFEMLFYKGQGSLFVSKTEKSATEVANDSDVVDMFISTFQKSYLHGELEHVTKADDNGMSQAKMIHNVLLFAVVPNKAKYNGVQFLSNASKALNEHLVTSENTNVYSGYIEDSSVSTVTTYVAYKIEGLPERLEKGLYEEYKEYQERRKNIQFGSSKVEVIEESKEDSLIDDLDELLYGTSKDDKPSVFTTSPADDILSSLDKPKDKAEDIQNFIDNFEF